jgi:hypothetical protein
MLKAHSGRAEIVLANSRLKNRHARDVLRAVIRSSGRRCNIDNTTTATGISEPELRCSSVAPFVLLTSMVLCTA